MFPTGLTDRAVRDRNGEYAFTRTDTAAAVGALRQAKAAILGGEVWLASHDGPRLITTASGDTVTYVWFTDRVEGESWEAFVQRAADDALMMVARSQPESRLTPDQADQVRFHLTYVTLPEFEQLPHLRPPVERDR